VSLTSPMHTCTHTHVRANAHAHAHTCAHTHVRAHTVCVCVCVCMCVCVCVCTCVYAHTPGFFKAAPRLPNGHSRRGSPPSEHPFDHSATNVSYPGGLELVPAVEVCVCVCVCVCVWRRIRVLVILSRARLDSCGGGCVCGGGYVSHTFAVEEDTCASHSLERACACEVLLMWRRIRVMCCSCAP
jgi:hypothetical protein